MFAKFPMERAKEVVDGIPEDRRVVLLGESTHGTEEFYRIREAVTKRLVEERGFTAVLFEADWPAEQQQHKGQPRGVLLRRQCRLLDATKSRRVPRNG